jgi:hypothetical protein
MKVCLIIDTYVRNTVALGKDIVSFNAKNKVEQQGITDDKNRKEFKYLPNGCFWGLHSSVVLMSIMLLEEERDSARFFASGAKCSTTWTVARATILNVN